MYKVKITNWVKEQKIEIQYPPNPTCYVYSHYESQVVLTEKLLDIMRDSKNADIEIIVKK